MCVTRADAGVQITPTGATATADISVSALDAVAAREDVTIRPLFGADQERMRAQAGVPSEHAGGDDATLETVDRMALFFHVDAPEDQLDELAERLRASDAVEGAYVKPAAALAVPDVVPKKKGEETEEAAYPLLNDMRPLGADAPPVTPDFTARQGYLDAAPGGVDARYAWTLAGGRGAGVRVIDCEWGWRFTHEDLRLNQGGIVSGTGSTDTDHGTAVLGEIGGDVNAFGITGIAPDAVTSASAFSIPTATAIRHAADRLGPGDIILLEIHRAGPHATGVGQVGYIAVEWWPDDYLAIRYAVNKGITVVEAAGNGAEDLDHADYDTPRA
ncbi:MAG: serine protease, partial [Streptomyces sp.]